MSEFIKKLLWSPVDLLQWYYDVMTEGHPVTKISVGLLSSVIGWVIFVLLHHIF